MSIFKRLLLNKKGSTKLIIKNSLIAASFIFSVFGQDVLAKGKSYVAVEPLVCDLVKSIALPSDKVTCLVDRKQDVHDLKINPRQAQLLNSADKVFTLGKEMTPSMRNWESKKKTVVVGVSAIDVDDHSDHEGHSDHSDHGGHDDHADHSAKVDDHSDHEGHGDHSDHGGLDPHIWHDPHNIIKMGKVVKNSFKKDISVFNRDDRKLINERFNNVDSLLEDLDSWIVEQVSSIPESKRVIVSKHKAMEYYGDAFGFETISLLDFLGDSSSLRPDNIKSVLAELKEDNVSVLFPEQKPTSKLLRNLSRQSSIPISSKQIFVDGLMMDGNTVSVAVHNTCTIVNSLGGSCDKKAGSNIESSWENLSN